MKHDQSKLDRRPLKEMVDAMKEGRICRAKTWSPNGDRKDHRRERRNWKLESRKGFQ